MALRAALVDDAERLSALMCLREDTWFNPEKAELQVGQMLEFLYAFKHLLSEDARQVLQRGLQKMSPAWFEASPARRRIDLVDTLVPTLVPCALHRVGFATPVIHRDLERLYPGLGNMVQLWTQLAPSDTQGKRKFYQGQMLLYLKNHGQESIDLSAPTDLLTPTRPRRSSS